MSRIFSFSACEKRTGFTHFFLLNLSHRLLNKLDFNTWVETGVCMCGVWDVYSCCTRTDLFPLRGVFALVISQQPLSLANNSHHNNQVSHSGLHDNNLHGIRQHKRYNFYHAFRLNLIWERSHWWYGHIWNETACLRNLVSLSDKHSRLKA